MPALQAAESIRMANRIAVGAGQVEASDRQNIVWGWEAAAGVKPLPAAEVSEEDLRAMGVEPRRRRIVDGH